MKCPGNADQHVRPRSLKAWLGAGSNLAVSRLAVNNEVALHMGSKIFPVAPSSALTSNSSQPLLTSLRQTPTLPHSTHFSIASTESDVANPRAFASHAPQEALLLRNFLRPRYIRSQPKPCWTSNAQQTILLQLQEHIIHGLKSIEFTN
ncbi:hypothetical protein N7G274_001900 [Stereocaulon virgatum]|uniref:Uncharacterized protein n=1 Tax=Stereocaulon virgatum TaxID=373712 RepID=A0ABR4AI63_9LECA